MGRQAKFSSEGSQKVEAAEARNLRQLLNGDVLFEVLHQKVTCPLKATAARVGKGRQVLLTGTA